MTSTMLQFITGCLVAFVVMMEVSAQAENCTLTSRNAQCAKNSECCSSCCLGGLCSSEDRCYAACNSTILDTAEGPDLCNLTKTIDNIAEEIKIINSDILSKILIFIVDTVKLVRKIISNPLEGLSDLINIAQRGKTVVAIFRASEIETRNIIGDFRSIIQTLTRVITELIYNHK